MPTHRLLAALAAAAVISATALAGSADAAPLPSADRAPRTTTVTVGSNPYDVAVAQTQGKAFVVNDGSMSVVSLLTRRQLAEFSTGGGHGQNAIALVRNTTQAYLTNNMVTYVTVVDTETHRVVRHVPVGYGAVDVVAANTPAGPRAYVLTNVPAALGGPGRNALVAIDTRTGKVTGRTPLPDFAYTMAVAPGATSIWVGSNDDGRIWQVDTTTGTITKTLPPTRSGPVTGIAFAPDGSKVWVSGLAGLSALNTRTGRSTAFVGALTLFRGFPQLGHVSLSASGRYVFVVNSVPNGDGDVAQLAAVDTTTLAVAWRVRTGSTPEGLDIDTRRNRAYVANYDDDTLTVVPIPH